MKRKNIEKIIGDGSVSPVRVSLDLVTKPFVGAEKVQINAEALVFADYVEMSKEYLRQQGKDPDGFKLAPRPWGTNDGAFIEHKGQLYLQFILVTEGETEYYVAGRRMGQDFKMPSRREEAVPVRCVKIENIQAMRRL